MKLLGMRNIKFLWQSAAIFLLFGAMGTELAIAQISARPVAVTSGKEIAAFLNGAACSERVDLLLRSAKLDHFRAGELTAARLVNNTINILQNQCVSLDRVTAQGYVGGDLVYSGIAEKGTGWRIIERGAGGGGLIGSGARADTGGKKAYAAEEDFVVAKTFVSALGQGQLLCEGHDAASNTCLSIITYEDLTETGVTMRVSQLQDASGLTAILKYKSGFTPAGFHCADPKAAEVTVTDGDMSDASRSDFADQLKARIEDIGNEACTGYIRKGDIVNIRNFDGEDQALPEQAEIRLMTSNPGLRIED